ncbi:DUF3108 domain-containing protein [Chitinophaga japonensis]|uniref:Uncharacterized protein DUF3108 n=1 Tax=Chitinophaga japonensis TaxID=104662 RepID=A0A562TFG2_CHIJA|nr:DUF3108 domain-containing protein [Chitinophaga japonensis]TWI92277.1 uncharacterized protein DUF3108 [Chitinophaga japonensis]
MRYFILIFLLVGLLHSYPVKAQSEFCGVTNGSFQPGEQITLKVFYRLSGVYVGAGEATFNCLLEKLGGKDVYHLVGEGKTYRAYDWFFKVRDRYESYVDTATLKPLKFIRNVSEGGYKIYNNVTFNQAQNTATSTNGTFKVPDCVQDVISAVYYARNIDFNKYKPNDKIHFDMFLDDEVYNIYIRYMGKEEVNTKFGKFRAIRFKPLLIKGTMFQGGEQMDVWVSDDANKVPLRIQSAISVGSIVVDMIGYKNLRHAFSSLIKKR